MFVEFPVMCMAILLYSIVYYVRQRGGTCDYILGVGIYVAYTIGGRSLH